MPEFDSTCDDLRNCSMYQHRHCSACGVVINLERCCGDSECHGYSYGDSKECTTCNECVLCLACSKKSAMCPHCVNYEAAIADRQYAHG